MVSTWQAYADYWNQHAHRVGPHGAVTHMDALEYQAYYEPILTRLAPPRVETVMDIGCGAGLIVPLVRRLWPAAGYIGLDISREMIDHCRREYPILTWLLMGGLHLPGRADFIICHSVLTHIGLGDAMQFLVAIRDALSDGGRASISVHTHCERGLRGDINRIDYEAGYFEAMLRTSGLRVVECVDGIQRYYGAERV